MQSTYYQRYVSHPCASQFGVSGCWALPTATEQAEAAAGTTTDVSATIWICTSANCGCGKVNCRPIQVAHPCCCCHHR